MHGKQALTMRSSVGLMKNRNHLISLHRNNFMGWCSQSGGAGVTALRWEHVALPLLREQLILTPGALISHKCVSWE